VEVPHTPAVEDTPEEDTPAVDTRRHNYIHQSKYQLSLSPLEKKKPTYETKTRRNQEEKNTPLRRVLRLLGVIALVRHCESLSGFAVRGFVEGIGDDVWEKLVKSDAWCGVVRGQSGPATDHEQTHKFFRQSRSSLQQQQEVHRSICICLSERLAVVCVWDLGTGMSNVVDETENVTS